MKNIWLILFFFSLLFLTCSYYENNEINEIPNEIIIDGIYDKHLQGIAYDHISKSFFASFTQSIIRIDLYGNVVNQVYLEGHHGDLAIINDLVYITYAREFNIGIDAQSKIKILSKELEVIDVKNINEVIYGAGCITYRKPYIYVSGGLKDVEDYNLIYSYDEDLNFVEKIVLPKYTKYGLQSMAYQKANRRFLLSAKFGKNQSEFFSVDSTFKILNNFKDYKDWGVEFVNNQLFLGINKELYDSNGKSFSPEKHIGKIIKSNILKNHN